MRARRAGATGAALLAPRVPYAQAGRLRIRASRDIEIVDPAFQTGGFEDWLQDCCLVSLSRYVGDGSARWEPYAARSIEVSEGGPALRPDFGPYAPMFRRA